MNEWTDTSLQNRHWRMCFERLFQAFARWQPGNLFDIAAQPILEYRELIVIHNCPCEHSSKLQTVYSIHTQSKTVRDREKVSNEEFDVKRLKTLRDRNLVSVNRS